VRELETYVHTKNDETSLYELKKQLEEFVEFKELTPELLHRLIEKIEIKADGKVKVHYRPSTPTAYSLSRIINAQHSTCVELIVQTGVTLVQESKQSIDTHYNIFYLYLCRTINSLNMRRVNTQAY
jgi:hypothetical protein